jgi:hypothetical protein
MKRVRERPWGDRWVPCYGYMSQPQNAFSIIPAKASIQFFQHILDPGFHRGDGIVGLRNWLHIAFD